jgi:hypothetical protein
MSRYSVKDYWRGFSRRMLLCFALVSWTGAFLVWRDEHNAVWRIGLVLVAVSITALVARSWLRAHKGGELRNEPNITAYPTS